MKIVTVLGARPQFIKSIAVSRAIRNYNNTNNIGSSIQELIVHTGQHFDHNMSGVFFTELEISSPEYNLGISGLSHGAMTGRMIESIETILKSESPDVVLVYGDTNSTLAAALAACKIKIPVAHIEAGLRSFNMNMPEEINRILTDRVSSDLFCPTAEAIYNLKNENNVGSMYHVGDVMFDVTLLFRDLANEKISLSRWGVQERQYALCTIHRAENTDDPVRLRAIFTALREISKRITIVLPIHPRTKLKLLELDATFLAELVVVEPLSYLEMVKLEMSAQVIMTDSGGIQKEAYFHKVPCITMRDETEWVETVRSGWNQIVGADSDAIQLAYENFKHGDDLKQSPYGDGNTSAQIVNILKKYQ